MKCWKTGKEKKKKSLKSWISRNTNVLFGFEWLKSVVVCTKRKAMKIK